MRGPRHIDVASQSDPILVRADGTYLYGFTSVVDDIAFGITHVIRSEDHVTKSGAQIQMFRALDAAVPAFGHLPLLVDATGGGLSKRTGSLAVADLRERGGRGACSLCAACAVVRGRARAPSRGCRRGFLAGRARKSLDSCRFRGLGPNRARADRAQGRGSRLLGLTAAQLPAEPWNDTTWRARLRGRPAWRVRLTWKEIPRPLVCATRTHRIKCLYVFPPAPRRPYRAM